MTMGASFCPNCGAPVQSGARFCASCGQAVASTPALTHPVSNVPMETLGRAVNETNESPEEDRPDSRARSSILVRLVVAFVLVSILPIGVLAALSLSEAAGRPEAEHQESGNESATGSEPSTADETLGGVPIFGLELAVAGISLVLSVGAALYVGRTIVRPMRSLEAAMHHVENGDLETTAAITRDDEIGHLATAFNRMVAGLRREAMVRDLFGQYVSPEVARLAIEQEGHLEGQVIRCTVLFADIRRFTALAEVLPPARLIGTLNRYFERMLAAVEAEGGDRQQVRRRQPPGHLRLTLEPEQGSRIAGGASSPTHASCPLGVQPRTGSGRDAPIGRRFRRGHR